MFFLVQYNLLLQTMNNISSEGFYYGTVNYSGTVAAKITRKSSCVNTRGIPPAV